MAIRSTAIILITALCDSIKFSSVSGEHFNESSEQLLHVSKRNSSKDNGYHYCFR